MSIIKKINPPARVTFWEDFAVIKSAFDVIDHCKGPQSTLSYYGHTDAIANQKPIRHRRFALEL